MALDWRDDLPVLFRAADVLVDNAGGATCAEAFAGGLPVVAHRPLPGHGRAGMRALVDQLRGGTVWVQALNLVLAVAGCVAVTRSPALTRHGPRPEP